MPFYINSTKNTEPNDIFLLIIQNDLPAIQLLLTSNPDFVNSRDQQSMQPIHYATLTGNFPLIELLLSRGADVNARGEFGKTPLHLAVSAGNYDLSELLINNHAVIDLLDEEGMSPLLLAVRDNNVDMTNLLLSRGGNPNSIGIANVTPLHFAVQNDNRLIVRWLLSSGANPNVVDIEGVSPLDLAIDDINTPMAELLIAGGASAHPISRRIPLFFAVRRGSIPLVRLLLQHGADINLVDETDKTILSYVGPEDDAMLNFLNTELLIRRATKPVTSLKEDSCPICLEQLREDPNNPILELSCGHQYDLNCLRNLIESTGTHKVSCSLCRRPLLS